MPAEGSDWVHHPAEAPLQFTEGFTVQAPKLMSRAKFIRIFASNTLQILKVIVCHFFYHLFSIFLSFFFICLSFVYHVSMVS